MSERCPNCTNCEAETDLAYMSIDTLKARIAQLERELATLKARASAAEPEERVRGRSTWDENHQGIGGGPGY